VTFHLLDLRGFARIEAHVDLGHLVERTPHEVDAQQASWGRWSSA
jgi:hypothetical protein